MLDDKRRQETNLQDLHTIVLLLGMIKSKMITLKYCSVFIKEKAGDKYSTSCFEAMSSRMK